LKTLGLKYRGTGDPPLNQTAIARLQSKTNL
jgi:hypothetical protein